MLRKALALAVFVIGLVSVWPTRGFVMNPELLSYCSVSELSLIATPYIVLAVSVRTLLVR